MAVSAASKLVCGIATSKLTTLLLKRIQGSGSRCKEGNTIIHGFRIPDEKNDDDDDGNEEDDTHNIAR